MSTEVVKDAMRQWRARVGLALQRNPSVVDVNKIEAANRVFFQQFVNRIEAAGVDKDQVIAALAARLDDFDSGRVENFKPLQLVVNQVRQECEYLRAAGTAYKNGTAPPAPPPGVTPL